MATGYLARFYPALAAAFAALTVEQQQSASLLATDLAIGRTGADVSVDDLLARMDLKDFAREWSSEEQAEASRKVMRHTAVSALKSAIGGRVEAAICDATLSIRDEEAILSIVASARDSGSEREAHPAVGPVTGGFASSAGQSMDPPGPRGTPTNTLVLYDAGGAWGYRIYTGAWISNERLPDLGSDGDLESAQAALLRLITKMTRLSYEEVVWITRRPGWWSSDLRVDVDRSDGFVPGVTVVGVVSAHNPGGLELALDSGDEASVGRQFIDSNPLVDEDPTLWPAVGTRVIGHVQGRRPNGELRVSLVSER